MAELDVVLIPDPTKSGNARKIVSVGVLGLETTAGPISAGEICLHTFNSWNGGLRDFRR